MKDLALAYIMFLRKFKCVKKPKMPKISALAYNDNEYKQAVEDVLKNYEADDLQLYEKFLKGK